MLQMIIKHYIQYKLTAGGIPPRSVFSRGCCSFTPPVGSVKWTELAWVRLINHSEFLLTHPMAECSSCVGRVDNCFVLCRTCFSSGSTTIINGTLYRVDPFVVICLHFHIRELYWELICTFGWLHRVNRVNLFSHLAILIYITLYQPEMHYMLTAAHLYSWKQSSLRSRTLLNEELL